MTNQNKHATPLVSIIMPTFNHAQYIAESIESIRQQTFANWELIIVDDGSEDGTERVILSIRDNRIQYIKAGRIAVGGIIKNIGLSEARGQFIAFIDSDDLWGLTKIEKQLAALSEYPEAGFCLTGGFNFIINEQPNEYYYKQTSGLYYDHLFTPLLRSEVAGLIPTLLFRRPCLEKVNEFKTHKSFSDIDFILSLAYHYKGIILYEPLLKRRIHQGNHSAANWLAGYSNAIDMVNSFGKLIPSALKKHVLFKMHINAGDGHLRRGQKLYAIGRYFKAWHKKPLSIVPIKKIVRAFMN